MEKKRIDAARTGLLLFDTLNAYLRPENPAKRKALESCDAIGKLQELIAIARDRGITIFYAFGDHSSDGRDYPGRTTDTDMDLNPWQGPQPLYRPPYRHGDDGGKIISELAPWPNDVLVPKHRWNAFYQTHLELSLRTRGIDTIILAGGSSDVGIAATAYAARDMDFDLIVVSDATYSVCRGPNHDLFITRVFPRMGRVLNVEMVGALSAAYT